MKAKVLNSFQRHLKKDNSSAMNSSRVNQTTSAQPTKMFIITSGSPWRDYDYIKRLGQTILVRQRSSYFRLANMQESPTSNFIQQTQVLARVSHPNIASIYGMYYYVDKILLVTEHLDISLDQLDFQSYELEEWEMATIIAEALKGLTYIYSMNISCQHLKMANFRLSVNGTIKLRLDLENVGHREVENPMFAPVLLELPVLEEIIGAMIISRYHTSADQGCSKEALSFLSWSRSGSLQNLLDVVVYQPLVTGILATPAAHPPCHPIYGSSRMIFTGVLLGGRLLHRDI
ncbi:hypothetical protein V492_00234 [Pseudogymnoascus sp. VKM F-4246]|nr:hypothetical protein V492_00234 [Pseudogymnoascus sp. VKM F-4246]